MNNKFLEELEWRGLLQDKTPQLEDLLNAELTSAYIGFDPTSDSLHIGNLIPILLLVHLQRHGHKPIALVGGATGMVGDPSGKSKERNLLDEATLQYNVTKIQKQLSQFLDFNPDLKNAAEVVNNYDWFKPISFLTFIRDVGKHITINYMVAKDSVKKRLESEQGISFTEFTYQLLQGYDFYYLFQHKNCKLQMGGSDQWGNIITGTELIRKKLNQNAHALTCPLLTKTDGGKFGKSEGGNIWLDPSKTSPYLFYQFWLNTTDEDAKKWIKIFTFIDQETIQKLQIEHEKEPQKRILQQRMAQEITSFVHGKENCEKSIVASSILFGNSNQSDLLKLDALDFIEITQSIPRVYLDKQKIVDTINVIELLFITGIFESKSEAKKMIQNGGLSINKNKTTDLQTQISIDFILFQQFILIQKGKKNYFVVELKN